MKVIVYCPGDLVTGGPEALHQLAAKGKALGYPVSIFYWPKAQTAGSKKAYGDYGVSVSSEVNDDPDTFVVVPESQTHLLRRFRNAKKVVWWLSIDNYYKSVNAFSLRRFLTRKPMFSLEEMKDIFHAVQSEYAREHLIEIGYKNIFMVTDYIRRDFLYQVQDILTAEKKDTVLYNPAKGIEFTQRLINIDSSINWEPIANKTPGEVIEMLKAAKLYVDFGHHPGRDRLPREAALCGCCVLTGIRGSARNNVDMPIPERYKYDQEKAGVDLEIVSHIRETIEKYSSFISDFDAYRESIRNQEAAFTEEVGRLLESFDLCA